MDYGASGYGISLTGRGCDATEPTVDSRPQPRGAGGGARRPAERDAARRDREPTGACAAGRGDPSRVGHANGKPGRTRART